MSRNSVEHKIGYTWAFGASAWILLAGTLAVVVPVGLIFGQTAGEWALGVVATLTLGMTWLFGEAVHALRVDQGDAEPVPLRAVSRRSL